MTEHQILQLVGLIYLSIGLGVLINTKFYDKIFNDYLKNPAMVYFSGFIFLLIGFLLIIFYGDWAYRCFRFIVSFIGWMSLLNGLFILVAPAAYISFLKKLRQGHKYIKWQAVFVCLIGIYLVFQPWISSCL